MQKIKDGITQLDRYPSTPSFKWNGITSKKTLIGGVIGLIFILLTLGLVIFKGISVINRSQIILQSFIKKDETSVEIRSQEIQMALLYYDGESILLIPYSLYDIFGVIPLMVQLSIDLQSNNTKTDTKFHLMEPCLGSATMVCVPDMQLKPQCDFANFDFQVCDKAIEYHYVVTSLDDDPILDVIYPLLFIIDRKYNLFQKDPTQLLKKVPMGLNKLTYSLNINHSYIFDVPVSKLELTSDQSILPSILKGYFYPSDKLRMVATNATLLFGTIPTYIDFYLHRSGFTQTYKRSYYRLDMMLGEIFGLLGLVGLVFAFCCAGYNEWLMAAHIKDSLNVNDDPSNEEKERHFGTYLKQKAINLKRKLIKSKPRDTVFLSEVEQKVKEIDIIQLYHKVQKMDKELTELKNHQRVNQHQH